MGNRPNFLIIGAPKCGTTSLYHYLAQNPKIVFSRMKEPKFFSFKDSNFNFKGHPKGVEQIRKTTVKNLDDYLNLFEGLSAENIGEASPNYFHFEPAPKNIYEFDPFMRLIVILRDPVERIYSDWKHNIRMGWEPIKDFKKLLKITPKRMENEPLPYYDYLNKGRYASHLKRYLKYFPEEQLKILFYDDFKNNESAVCNEILSFLDIQGAFSFKVDKVYMKSDHTPRSRRLLWLSKRMKSFSPSLSHFIRCVNAIPEEMGEKERFFLKNFYRREIEELEELTGRNLDIWKT